MKIKILIYATILTIFASCQLNQSKIENKNTLAAETPNKNQMTDIAYTIAKNYFVKNTVKNLDNPKIEALEKFDESFGMATTIGKDGRPTEIDFTKEYVIAVILPETDLMTTLTPLGLQKDKEGRIKLTFKTIVGQKQSYTTRPNFLIIVNKTENGMIELEEEK